MKAVLLHGALYHAVLTSTTFVRTERPFASRRWNSPQHTCKWAASAVALVYKTISRQAARQARPTHNRVIVLHRVTSSGNSTPPNRSRPAYQLTSQEKRSHARNTSRPSGSLSPRPTHPQLSTCRCWEGWLAAAGWQSCCQQTARQAQTGWCRRLPSRWLH